MVAEPIAEIVAETVASSETIASQAPPEATPEPHTTAIVEPVTLHESPSPTDQAIKAESELLASVAELQAVPLMPPEVGAAVIFAAQPVPEPASTPLPESPPLPTEAAFEPVSQQPVPEPAAVAEQLAEFERGAEPAAIATPEPIAAATPEPIAVAAAEPEAPVATAVPPPAGLGPPAPPQPEPTAKLAKPAESDTDDLAAFLFGPDLDLPVVTELTPGPPPVEPRPFEPSPGLPAVDLAKPGAEPDTAPDRHAAAGSGHDPLAPLDAMSEEEKIALFT
jgi:hypothetical protein